MSEITRRQALGRLAAAFATAGALDQIGAAEAHAMVAQATAGGGPYAPKALSAHQYLTLSRLTDLIIPVEDGRPGAVQAGVPVWIDTLLDVNAELQRTYQTGLAWIDDTMRGRHDADFLSATTDQQTGLLDQIAFQRNRSSELDAGIDFFILLRRMTVDGFYTSPIGMRDIYPGNVARSAFTIPQDAMDYVISRSPLK